MLGSCDLEGHSFRWPDRVKRASRELNGPLPLPGKIRMEALLLCSITGIFRDQADDGLFDVVSTLHPGWRRVRDICCQLADSTAYDKIDDDFQDYGELRWSLIEGGRTSYAERGRIPLPSRLLAPAYMLGGLES